MPIIFTIAAIIVAYLLGSIPTSVWVGKMFYNTDVREHGSGNAGATNTFRVLGVKAGIPVLIIDILKGFAAVKLILLSSYYQVGSIAYINVGLIMGSAALLGHIFPVFAGFKGGKGVATLVGIVLALHLYAALISIGIFIIILLISRYVSLSSMIGGIMFPISIIFIFKSDVKSLIVFSIIISILLLVTHKKNIVRLLRQEESKANIFKKHHHKENESD